MMQDSVNTAGGGELAIRPRYSRFTWVFLVLTAVGALLLFWPVAAFVVYQDVDHNNHLSFLRELANGGSLSDFLAYYPHFVYHLLVYGVSRFVPGGDFNAAALLVSVLFYVLAVLAVYGLLVGLVGRPPSLRTGGLYALLALALMLVMPFNLLTPHNLYLGYIVIHAYHNPTILAVKPFALLLFWFAGRAVLPPEPPAHQHVVVLTAALVSAFGVLAKPSYAMALLPAFALIVAVRRLRRQYTAWWLAAGVMLPAALVMGWQRLMFTSTDGFVLAPLALINHWAGMINPAANEHLVLKFLLSALFPLLVYGMYPRAAVRSLWLTLAWLTFLVGAAYMYLLVEGGAKLGHANFTWSAQVALWVLFAASLAFFMQQNRSLRWSPRLLVGVLAFGLHLVSGLHWYSLHVNASQMGAIIANFW